MTRSGRRNLGLPPANGFRRRKNGSDNRHRKVCSDKISSHTNLVRGTNSSCGVAKGHAERDSHMGSSLRARVAIHVPQLQGPRLPMPCGWRPGPDLSWFGAWFCFLSAVLVCFVFWSCVFVFL